METTNDDEIRTQVRNAYAKVAGGAGGCSVGCCGTEAGAGSMALGYSEDELAAAPEGADLGLGCGNPQAIAALQPGEVVLDLGSGGGFDCFLAARRVGAHGHVIGVDMTPEMVTKARANARKVHARNVEFRLGEIEQLPVADAAVDVILSNCVINLSPDKPRVLREALRVLKPGGRLAISDVVALADMPDELRQSVESMTGCVSGAARLEAIEQLLRDTGFEDVRVEARPESRAVIAKCMPGAENYVVSAGISARKPGAGRCCDAACCA